MSSVEHLKMDLRQREMEDCDIHLPVHHLPVGVVMSGEGLACCSGQRCISEPSHCHVKGIVGPGHGERKCLRDS